MQSTSERFRNRLELSNWFLQVLSAGTRPSDPTPRPGFTATDEALSALTAAPTTEQP